MPGQRWPRRPYRVVFTRPDQPRTGTIIVAEAHVAHREARTIAREGGTAEVHYVAANGDRTILATYTP